MSQAHILRKVPVLIGAHGYARVRTGKIVGTLEFDLVNYWMWTVVCNQIKTHKHTRKILPRWCFRLWDLFITWHLLHDSKPGERKKTAYTTINWVYRKSLIRAWRFFFFVDFSSTCYLYRSDFFFDFFLFIFTIKELN